jgi:hypothetical protein
MKFTLKHTDLIYSALDIILDDDAVDVVFRDDHFVVFKTLLGKKGLILPNKKGGREIYINDKIIYIIEKEVYSIISYEGNTPKLETYIPRLILLNDQDLQEKSKILVSTLLKEITKLTFSGLVKINLEEDFGPFNYIQVLRNPKENSVKI